MQQRHAAGHPPSCGSRHGDGDDGDDGDDCGQFVHPLSPRTETHEIQVMRIALTGRWTTKWVFTAWRQTHRV
jgi:hypothetical protein